MSFKDLPFELQEKIIAFTDSETYKTFCKAMPNNNFVYVNRDIWKTAYYKNNKLHRDNDQPAVIKQYGKRLWYQHGTLHRDNDLPAIITHGNMLGNNMAWYQHGKRHRDNDQPAVIHSHGTKYWYQYGLLHRDNDQPAAMLSSGLCEWHQRGVIYKVVEMTSHGPLEWLQNKTYEY
jgi:hypothetical protein